MWIAVVAASAPLLASVAGVDFSFDRAVGTYENVDVETLPATTGAVDLRLSSPENTVTIESGSLQLEPAEEGLHKALLELGFSGEGQLVTEVKIGTIPARFEDYVRFPQQEHRVTAWVTIEPVDEGYRIVAKQLPETVQIRLESDRAAGLAGLCRQMSLFLASDAGCDKLESMLSNPKIPLPKPGSDFLVRRETLTEGEIERLELYLAGTKLSAR